MVSFIYLLIYLFFLHFISVNDLIDFISHLKWTAHAQKMGFSSSSCSDKTTDDKFDGHMLK